MSTITQRFNLATLRTFLLDLGIDTRSIDFDGIRSVAITPNGVVIEWESNVSDETGSFTFNRREEPGLWK